MPAPARFGFTAIIDVDRRVELAEAFNEAWRHLRTRIMAGEFDVVMRVSPVTSVLPSPFAFFLRNGPIPFVIGPINGGLPWPPGFSQADKQKERRSEQLREKRCLIPASGFYEWKTVDGKKRPCHFTMKDGRPFAFAGLWDVWRGVAKPLLTCCLITTHANDLVRPVHDRMPVIVPPDRYAEWLDVVPVAAKA